MPYFACSSNTPSGGGGGGGLPSEFNLYPFPLLSEDNKVNGEGSTHLFDYSQSPASLRDITQLKSCEIRGRILGYSDYSSSALQQIDMYCALFARSNDDYLYYYDLANKTWKNSFNGTTYKVNSGSNFSIGAANNNTWQQTCFRAITYSTTSVPKNNQIYVDADYTVDFTDAITKAQALDLHFDVEETSNIIVAYVAFGGRYMPIKTFTIFYGYMVGRQSSYYRQTRFTVDKTQTVAKNSYDSKAILEANPPQVKLIF